MSHGDGAAVHLTTNPGFEDLALAELRRLAAGAGLPDVRGTLKPDGMAGHLWVEADTDAGSLEDVARRLRSVHRLVRPVARVTLGPEPLAQIRALLAELAPTIPELAPEAATFRISSKRTGSHGFTSEDVQRQAGAGVRDALNRAVSLKFHDVEIRCDVRHERCLVGVQLSGKSLSQRSEGPYTQRTSLRANVAWCLLELARPEAPPVRLLDPFVGTGTILEEAGARWPEVALCGGDLFDRAHEGALANLTHAGLAGRLTLRQGDARSLEARWPEGSFDTIVSNPPFGKRLGRDVNLHSFYEAFLSSADKVATPDARMVLLVHKRGAFNHALGRVDGWRTRHVRVVELGGMYVGVFVLSRP